ncbi:hypothetical protein [Zemynaea arenosa]|uniref:hypothetical protein n=1 Tax=Zemynaea arenosa TaxID=2561931 RepID=UPI0015E1989E|nr:hypothetical protein [Massilia arenosa]
MPVYVQHQVLGNIDDVFNAEAIWRAPGLALFSRRPLLRDLLERSPREHRGRAPTRCFSHVTLVLPQEDVDDDRHLTRGSRARDLVETLKTLHQKDFGDLLGTDEVRYDVVGDERLQPGEVEVRFGHAVYLPAQGEPVLYNVTVSRDSAVWKPVCQVYLDQRLAVLGQDEESASHGVPGWPFGEECQVLLINDGPEAPVEVQVRPKNVLDCHYDPLNGCYVIRGKDAVNGAPRLFLKLARTLAAAKTRSAAEVAASDARASVWKSRSGAQPIALGQREMAMTQERGAGQAAAAASKVGMRSAAKATVAAVATCGDGADGSSGTYGTAQMEGGLSGSRPAAQEAWPAGALGTAQMDAQSDATAVPVSHRPALAAAGLGLADAEATYAPVARQSATLVALALPRLSRYRDTGAASLCFGFDESLGIAADPSRAVLTIAVDAADNVSAANGDGQSAVTIPATFTPVDARAITLAAVPRPMADRYLALVTLPEPRTAAISRGARLSFGRAAAALSTLRVLDSGALLRQTSATASATAGTPAFATQGALGSSALGTGGGGPAGGTSNADRLGLSRTAFSFEAGDGVYRITRQSPTQALYHLDDKLRFVAAIGDATPDQPYMLPSGHHLVAGHYVLRFDA